MNERKNEKYAKQQYKIKRFRSDVM